MIGKRLFDNCENLKNIVGMTNVETIGEYAFSGCEKLEELEMTSVNNIGPSAFAGSNKLKSIVIPNTMKDIPYAMCMRADSLETVGIPEGVESIDALVFSFSYGLKNVYIPSSVTAINDSVFAEIEDQITIYGERDSYAEKYVHSKGIKFEEVSN